MNGKCHQNFLRRGGLILILTLFTSVAGAFPTFNTKLDSHILQQRQAWALQGGILLPDATWRALSTVVNEKKVVTQAYYWQARWEYLINNNWAVRAGAEWQEIYNKSLHFIGVFLGRDIVDILYAKLRHRFYGVFSFGFAPYVEFYFHHASISPQQDFNHSGTAYQGKFSLEYEYLWRPSWHWRATLGYFYERPMGIEDTPKVSVKDLIIQGPYGGINLIWRP